ncbi:HAD family hydrolase NDAI_0C02090 [Naumovozyma dairenensis CBS 421]|uniref:Uncharacterized protein n=1 Tax=Naumovozyma dairenensis (strain ATCC 10597 / BCRC 20456 / CBS 421 / NBRC 0211 / NRRL Y-12639) TaxID=1071378 RepID=G0W7V8_NAUDC|nr:hypothetical protein NDAI_0C02090 [Naumovozyma dairenensis CBS 421]CCD23869.1 hypothetical protein NDAI_0C02090 [Naumovozyma dairenensis CBS 421]
MASFTVDFCLFDLDGTIVSTTVAAESAWKKLCAEYDVDPEKLFKYSHGARSNEIMARFFPKLDNSDNKAVKELELSMAYDYLDTVQLIPGSKDLLISLDKETGSAKEVGQRKWAIVTSGSPYLAYSWFDTILKEIGKPDTFITGFDVKNGKPDPEGYAKARDQLCETLKLDKEKARYVVFEDAPVGITAGKKIGAITVGITSTYDKEVLFDAGADFVVEDLTHVTVNKNNSDGIIIEIFDPVRE